MAARAPLYIRPPAVVYVSCSYICVLILLYMLYMCPHTAIYVSSYFYICLLRPPAAIYVSSCFFYNSICVLQLYMCPHTAIYVSSFQIAEVLTHTEVSIAEVLTHTEVSIAEVLTHTKVLDSRGLNTHRGLR